MVALSVKDGVALLVWAEDVRGRARFEVPSASAIRHEDVEAALICSGVDVDAPAVREWAALAGRPAEREVVGSNPGDGDEGPRVEGRLDGPRRATLLLLHEPLRPCDEERARPLREILRGTPDGRDLFVTPEITNRPERMITAERFESVDGTWTPRAPGGIKPPRLELFKTLREMSGDNLRVHLARDVNASVEAAAAASGPAVSRRRQSTNAILMVAPSAFESNIQAAADNHFMIGAHRIDSNVAARRRVLAEYAGLVQLLTEVVGLEVHLFDHGSVHGTPDACFPNNWFSTTQDNHLVLYPMKTPNRRAERRGDIINHVKEQIARRQGDLNVVDLTAEETAAPSRILEGTGCLVLDNVNRVAYVSLSERADGDLAAAWGERIGYRVVTFTARDAEGRPIYHTNVMMSVGTSAAVVCVESVTDHAEREALLRSLASTGHEVIPISLAQVGCVHE